MSSYTTYEQAPNDVRLLALRLWRSKKEPSKLPTERLLHDREIYQYAVGELNRFNHPLDDEMLGDLQETLRNIENIIDYMLLKEQYGRLPVKKY